MIQEKKIEGTLDLKTLKQLLQEEYEFLDISDAKMGIEEERYEVCLGWSHSGPVYGAWLFSLFIKQNDSNNQ